MHAHRLTLSVLFFVNLLAFAACTSTPSTGGPATAPTTTGPAQPRVSRVVMAVSPPSLEGATPNRDVGTPQSFQVRPMYEYLVGVDAQSGKLVPQLATEWKVEPDGKSWRFKLRRGVPFHGRWGEFTSKDVVFSHSETVPADTINSNPLFFRESIEKVEVMDDYEVVVRMRAADSDSLNLMGEQIGGFAMLSKAANDANGRPSVTSAPTAGTGPYQFKERAPGSYIRFERASSKHWRSTPDFPEFEFRWMKEASSRLAALLTEEIHISPLPQDLLPQAAARGMSSVKGRVAALRVFVGFLCCNFKNPADPSQGYDHPESPLMDVRLRHALNRAVNRDEINKSFFRGKGEPMYVNHFHASRPGWNPEWERRFPAEYRYEPALARKLLEEAGYGPQNPYRINFLKPAVPDVPEAEDVFDAVASYWRAVGVQVNQISMDPAQVTATGRAKAWDNHATILVTGSSQLLGFIVYNASFPGIGSGQNPVDNLGLYALIGKIKQEMDERRNAELWKQVGDLSFSLYQNVPLFWLPAEAAVNPKVVGDYVFPGAISGTWTHVDGIKAAR